MKKLVLSLILGMGFLYSAQAQAPVAAQNTQVIKTNPLALAFGSFNVS